MRARRMHRAARGLVASLAALAVVGGLLTGCVAADGDRDGDRAPAPDAVDVGEAFATGDIAVLDDAGEAWPEGALMASPASAVEVMQSEVESGGGMPGEDLDELVPMPAGAPSFSYLVAAWLSDPATPRAESARTWFPVDVDWSRAPSVWYPRAALLLFVADAMEASLRDFGTPDAATDAPDSAGDPVAPAIAPASLFLASGALPQAPCSTVSDFFAKTITAVFTAVQLPPDFLGTGGLLGAISGFLAGLYNTAVALAKQALLAVIETLTAPVLRAIGSGVAIVGVVSHLSSYLLGVSMNVVASERLVVLDGRDGSWYGLVDSNRPFEAQLADCLAVLGQKPLPDVVKAGETVRWREYLPTKANGYTFERVALSYPALTSTVDAGGRIVLPWVAATDPESSRPAEIGTVRIRAEVPKGDVTELLRVARKLVDQAVKAVAADGGPLAPQIEAAINGILLPIVAQVEREILGVGRSLLMIVGAGAVPFQYREPDLPSQAPGAAVPNCYVGAWRFERLVSSSWLDLSRSAFQRFTLDIGPQGSYQLRVVGWAVHEPEIGGLWSAYEGATRFTTAPGADGAWAVTAPRLTATLSTASLYMPLGNGYAIEADDQGAIRDDLTFINGGNATDLSGNPTSDIYESDGQFGEATFGAGLRPIAFSCGADGQTLVVTGEADSRYGSAVWEFRRR